MEEDKKKTPDPVREENKEKKANNTANQKTDLQGVGQVNEKGAKGGEKDAAKSKNTGVDSNDKETTASKNGVSGKLEETARKVGKKYGLAVVYYTADGTVFSDLRIAKSHAAKIGKGSAVKVEVYVGSNMGHYSGMFNEQNLLELLEICKNLKGKFMLTMYPNKDIEHCVASNGWTVHKIDRQVSACKADSRRRQEEWIVCNY